MRFARAHGPVSRAQLAACGRPSKPTVSDQVDSLIPRSLVVETGPGSAGVRGGGKPTLLEFNRGYRHILCADFGTEWKRFADVDPGGNFLERSQLATWPEKDARAVLRNLKRVLADRLPSVAEANIRVIGVTVPGIVDGVVLDTDNVFGWRDVKLADELANEFGLPVRIDNDVNMAALGELGAGSAPDIFVFIRLHTGIRSAVVVGGQLHHGAHWAAGEVGHTLLDEPFGEVLSEICRLACRLLPWPVDVRLSELDEDAALHRALAVGLNHAYSKISNTLQTVAAGPIHLSAAQK